MTKIIGIFCVFLSSLFLACQKTEKNPQNFTSIEFPNEIKVDSGYTTLTFGTHELSIYSPKGFSGEAQSLIFGFVPTPGTNNLMRGILRHVADSLNAMLICPKASNDFDLTMDNIMSMKQFQQDKVFVSGYSAGGAYAFYQSQRLEDKIKGVVLLAGARRIVDALPPFPNAPVCLCSGTEDVVYPGNIQLYDALLENDIPVKLIEIEGYDHGAMFSARYPKEVSECFDFVN